MTKCPASFWKFAGPVLVGNLAGLGANWLTRKLATGAHPETARTMGMLVGGAMFWLAGGLTWVALHPRENQPSLP